jgi:branched-chain amino acid transport system permease protein
MTNTRLTRTFSFGEFLVLVSALVMLAAFLFLPWYDLKDNAGTVTGYQIVKDTQGELDLAARATHMFLIVVPVAAISAIVIVFWGIVAPRYDRRLPGFMLLAGLIAVGYYYGAFFYENQQNSVDALPFVDSGFYVTLVASLGLIVQFAIPRPKAAYTLWDVRFHPPTLAAFESPSVWWRWPSAVVRGVWGWIGAVIGWLLAPIGRAMNRMPVLAYLVGIWAAAEIERREGAPFAKLLGFRRAPSLFGATELLEPFSKLDFSGILAPFFPAPTDHYDKPLQASWTAIRDVADTFIKALSTQGPRDPGFFNVLLHVVEYDIVVFVIPVVVIALLLRGLSNRTLVRLPTWAGIGLQILVLYGAVSRWGAFNDYRELVLIYMGVNIMLAVSLNLVNGYMGEFSVGHAGFMAVGAYVSSLLTMRLLVNTNVFGEAVINAPHWALPIGFFIALIAGGAAAALAGLMVAFPSFRTRGDYLAIVTLAVNFIVTGVINNIEAIGGPRGLNGVPLWTNVRWIFFMTVLSVIIIYNLVSSTFGKGIIAIRDDEIAAELMGVDTKRVKVVAFMVSSFIAGMSGGLFAHVLAYVNPGVFGILKSTEALVMVYLGGMGSISGSVIAAAIFTILIEALRPLAVLKWVVLPIILILLMLYRPQGLYGFREMKLNLSGIRETSDEDHEEASDGAPGD